MNKFTSLFSSSFLRQALVPVLAVCAGFSMHAQPANDLIANATLLPVQHEFPLTSTLGTTVDATGPFIEHGLNVLSLGGHTHGRFTYDVWYKAQVPPSGSVAVNVSGGDAFELIALMYQGTSDINQTPSGGGLNSDHAPAPGGPPSLIARNKNGGTYAGGDRHRPWIHANGLTPGTYVWIRIAVNTDVATPTRQGNFNIALTEGKVWNTAGASSNPGALGNWLHTNTDATYASVNLPGANTTIIIPAGGTQPVVATIDRSYKNIRFVNTVSDTASITVNAGRVLTVGSGASSFVTGLSNSFHNGVGLVKGEGRILIGGTDAEVAFVRQGSGPGGQVAAAAGTVLRTNNRLFLKGNAVLLTGKVGGTQYGSIHSGAVHKVTYERVLNAGYYQFSYLSSPVLNSPATPILSPVSTHYIHSYYYSASGGGWVTVGGQSNLMNGKGYIAQGLPKVVFNGKPFDDDQLVYTLDNATGNRWNLVGNPYMTPVSFQGASNFFNQNTGKIVGNAAYLWSDDNIRQENTEDGYTGIAANGDVFAVGTNPYNTNAVGMLQTSLACAVGQSFMIEAAPGESTIVFNQQMRNASADNAIFFEEAEAQMDRKLKIRLTNRNNRISEAGVIFSSRGEDEYHLFHDTKWYHDTRIPIGMYSRIGDVKLLVNNFGELATDKTVDFYIINDQAGDATFSVEKAENFEGSSVVLLEDLVSGVFHNLSQNPVYHFQNDPAKNNNARFRLHFRAPVNVTAERVCNSGTTGSLTVSNPNAKRLSVELKDASGTVVSSAAAFTGDHMFSGLHAGAYLISGRYEDGAVITQAVALESIFAVPVSISASATDVKLSEAIIEFSASTAVSPSATFSWSFGDGTVVNGQAAPVHAYMQPGVYTVTLRVADNGCETESSAVITVRQELITGIDQLKASNDFVIYPNPARESLNLLLNLDKSEKAVQVNIFTAEGRLVKSESVRNVKSGAMISVDIQGLAAGIYQVSVEGKHFKKTSRLSVVQ